jgi:hypothetical protein
MEPTPSINIKPAQIAARKAGIPTADGMPILVQAGTRWSQSQPGLARVALVIPQPGEPGTATMLAQFRLELN